MENFIPLNFQDFDSCKTPTHTPLEESCGQINNWCIPKMYSDHDDYVRVLKSPIVELTPERVSNKSPASGMDQTDGTAITPNTSAFIQSIRPMPDDNVDMWMSQILPSPKSDDFLELDRAMEKRQVAAESVKEPLRLPVPRQQSRDHRKASMARKLTFGVSNKVNTEQLREYAKKEKVVQTAPDKVRNVLRAIDEEVPAIGLTEEVKTQFAVVEIKVTHNKKGKRMVLGMEDSRPSTSTGKGKIVVTPDNRKTKLNNSLSDAPQPFRVVKCADKINLELVPSQLCLTSDVPAEDFDSICHFMRYEMIDGRKTKVYECGICRRTFKHQYTLMRHLPTHTDERNFACETCGKAFRQMSTLIQHGAIHSNVRPYVCDICHSTFNRVSTLISHKKTHSGNKLHLCTYCGKRFHQKGNLRNHIFTHTNERPYKCELCGKGFNQKSNLICHRSRYHAAQEDFPCELCAVKFPKKRGLVSHMFYKHNVEAESNARHRKPTEKPLRPKEPKKTSAAAVPNMGLKKSFYPSAFKEVLPRENGSGDNNSKPPTMRGPPERDSMQHMMIDPINNEAMTTAKAAGQIPFVLFKTISGAEQLMRVMSAPQFNKQLLVPVTVEDLKATQNGLKKVAPNTTLEFQVQTVATLRQIFDNGIVKMIEIPQTSSCKIKIEPVFQNLALTQITGWPGPAVTTSFVNPDLSVNNMDAFPNLSQWRQDSEFSCFQAQTLFPANLEGASFGMLDQFAHLNPELLQMNSINMGYQPYRPFSIDNDSSVQLSMETEDMINDEIGVDFTSLLS